LSASAAENSPHRALLTGAVMLATLMQVLDSTIANVALPYMQGSLSASWEEVTWILTSYVIAAAIMTAPVGWMAVRFGRKNLFIACLAGFTITSMMCGAAQTLEQMILFRVLQGVCGAALVPLSQATMLDIYPFEQRAQAMAIFGMGIMVGPIAGPTLGGYLTDLYNWRFVFYVNLPFGILAILGVALFMPRTPVRAELKFDWTGFGVLAVGIGCLQLMLDRGSELDWFSSREIVVEAVLAGLGLYLFAVHMFTAEKPFIAPAVFRDRNFTSCMLLMFFTGTILMSSAALMAPYLQTLAGYPVSAAGLAMAPRGLGVMTGMMFASRVGRRFDQRKLMAAGLVVLGMSMHEMSSWTPDIAQGRLMLTLIVQGFAMGCIFNPMTVMAFTTLPAHLRGDATALQALARNIGSAVGISVTSLLLTRSEQVSHEEISAVVTPFHRALQGHGVVGQFLDPASASGAQMLDMMVNRQAQIVAYANDYRLMTWVVVPPLLLLLCMRRAGRPTMPVASAPAVPTQPRAAE
jgi:DHA2 family multidrug resistance protein